MSIKGKSDPDMIYKKQFHKRKDSGELDVFEAAHYFSGYNETNVYNGKGTTFSQKEDRDWRGRGRVSLDLPMRKVLSLQQSYTVEKQMKEKKFKQPSSPGGRLASFLNSLLSSRKKKSKSSVESVKDEDESPNGRRKRRSSISYFPSSISTTSDSKSIYSSSSSGLGTPPLNVQTPTKSHKEFRSIFSKYSENMKSEPTDVFGEKIKEGLSGFDEKLKLSNGLLRDDKNFLSCGYSEKGRVLRDKYQTVGMHLRKLNEEIDDEGAESDSSSDLFELHISDLDYYSTSLPVYETTHMDSIKRGAPISNGSL